MLKEQFKEMEELQDKLNIHTCGKDWKKNCTKLGRATVFPLAGAMETLEAIDSVNWKHWKDLDKKEDLDNLLLELVDIGHFIFSLNLQHEVHIKTEYLETIPEEVSRDNVIDEGVILIKSLLDIHKDYSLADVFTLNRAFCIFAPTVLSYVSKDWNDFYKLYISKNVLNIFRQDNGYADGTYIKEWNGIEDNIVLAGILETTSDISFDILYSKLEESYKKLR